MLRTFSFSVLISVLRSFSFRFIDKAILFSNLFFSISSTCLQVWLFLSSASATNIGNLGLFSLLNELRVEPTCAFFSAAVQTFSKYFWVLAYRSSRIFSSYFCYFASACTDILSFVQNCSRYLLMNLSQTSIPVIFCEDFFYTNRRFLFVISKLKQCIVYYNTHTKCQQMNLQQEQKYTDVLVLQDSDSEEEDPYQGPKQYKIEIVSFQQLGLNNINQKLVERYRPVSLIHQNQYSVVVQCKSKEESMANANKWVAVKFCPLAQQQYETLLRINKYKDIRNIIKPVQIFNDAIVLEFYEGNLKDFIRVDKILPFQLIVKILLDLIIAFEVLEELSIVYSDIKPENILYKHQKQEKREFVLVDFADVMLIDAKIESKTQSKSNYKKDKETWQYRPPEMVVFGGKIGYKIHIWGLGCVLFECLTGETLLPLEVDSQQSYQKTFVDFASQQQIKLRLKRFSIPSYVQKLQKLLIQMLKPDSSERPSLKQCKEALLQFNNPSINNP